MRAASVLVTALIVLVGLGAPAAAQSREDKGGGGAPPPSGGSYGYGGGGGGGSSGDLRFENFEARLGGSLGYDVMDTGASRLPSLAVGGILAIDFHVWFDCSRSSDSCFGLSVIANLLDLRTRVAGSGVEVAGGTQDGAGVIGRGRLDVTPGSYWQAWIGYWFVGDAQATYPSADDLLAFWHLVYARARIMLAPVAIELGGGVSDSNQAFHAGVRFALGSNWHLGGEIDGYFNNGEGATHARTEPGSQRWGRELWVTHLFVAVDFGDF